MEIDRWWETVRNVRVSTMEQDSIFVTWKGELVRVSENKVMTERIQLLPKDNTE